MKQGNWYQIFGNTHKIPDGRTVLPTDDIQILLNCANIWDKAYTTIAQLLADTTSLMTVISDNNAIDYLVRSTTFASSVTADSSAMTYIGQNNYAANTLIADETWCEAFCGSEYAKSVFNIYVPKMTDNTHPSGVASASSIYAGDVSLYGAWRAFDGNDVGGTPLASTQQASHGWLQYQFTEPVIIKAVHYKGQDSLWSSRNPSGYLQGSNDGVTYDNIKAVNYRSAQIIDDAIENSNSYNRYRFYNSSSSSEYLTAATIQFYGRKDV